MPTCQYISKLRAGAVHFESYLDCSHEFRATYGIELKRNGTDLTENCLVQFYKMKKFQTPPLPSDEGWTDVPTSCSEGQYYYLCSIDGEWQENLPNQNYLWLKAHVEYSGEDDVTIDLVGKATFKCSDHDGLVQWTCANHFKREKLYIDLDTVTTTIPTPSAPSINKTTQSNHPKIYWNAVLNAKTYKIYKKRGSGSFQYHATTSSLNYIDTGEYIYMGSGPKITIYYKIKAANSCGNLSAYSNQRQFSVEAD